MKTKSLFVKILCFVCLFALTAPVFISCNKDTKEENADSKQEPKPQPPAGPLANTVWEADTSISTPQNLPIQLPDITVEFTSTLNFIDDTSGFYTISVDMFDRTDTIDYIYNISRNRGYIVPVFDTSIYIDFTKNGDRINVPITRNIIPGADTSAIFNAVFAYIEYQGGLSFNYYKK
ncbi:MAG: hypothetical protein K5650_00590 [Bacteroidales bacterium]|nr:hypothetical protein [Bacteroidales bacterium]